MTNKTQSTIDKISSVCEIIGSNKIATEKSFDLTINFGFGCISSFRVESDGSITDLSDGEITLHETYDEVYEALVMGVEESTLVELAAAKKLGKV